MDDVIFLLSKDEYLKYRESIPQLSYNWWLRSSSFGRTYAAVVIADGSISGCDIARKGICVRPALDLDKIKINKYENNFIYCGVTWVKISKNIAISELPIGMQIFNKDFNNNYENSDIREWILDWYEKRKNY